MSDDVKAKLAQIVHHTLINSGNILKKDRAGFVDRNRNDINGDNNLNEKGDNDRDHSGKGDMDMLEQDGGNTNPNKENIMRFIENDYNKLRNLETSKVPS